MNEKELRELDNWIADKIPELKHALFQPTTIPSDAMLVLKKCATDPMHAPVMISEANGIWSVSEWNDEGVAVEAETLPLAICLFAKQLFS